MKINLPVNLVNSAEMRLSMNFEEFKKCLLKEIAKLNPEIVMQAKLNRKEEMIYCNAKSGRIAIPLHFFYQIYEKDRNFERIIKIMEADIGSISQLQVLPLQDWEYVKKNIIFCLCNTKKNEEFLKDTPHREWLDLSIIYRCIVAEQENNVYSYILKEEMVEKLGITEEELFIEAVVNTKRKYPVIIQNLADIMKQNYGISIFNKNMYFISNSKQINGAASMLYTTQLLELANKVQDDLYLLLSSIHEILAVPISSGLSKRDLLNMVKSVNGCPTAVPQKDCLSDSVYYFSKENEVLSLAYIVKLISKRVANITCTPFYYLLKLSLTLINEIRLKAIGIIFLY